jgi:chondroitin 4-sulfotransferase 11
VPIDLERRFVFVHVPKTGGTSVESLFGLTRTTNFFSPRPILGLSPGDRTPQHFTWRELRPNLPEGFPAVAFKFAFVRNPWDRFLSEFLWRCRALARGRRHAYSAYLQDLDSFVRALDLPPVLRRAADGFDGHLESQTSFVVDESNHVAMDFVGRFETFEVDLRRVANRIGVVVGPIPHLRKSSREGDYRSWYSSYSRSAVERFYHEDIRTFDYHY